MEKYLSVVKYLLLIICVGCGGNDAEMDKLDKEGKILEATIQKQNRDLDTKLRHINFETDMIIIMKRGGKSGIQIKKKLDSIAYESGMTEYYWWPEQMRWRDSAQLGLK